MQSQIFDRCDPVLRPFLTARTPEEATARLERLLQEEALPVIRGVLIGRGLRLPTTARSGGQTSEELDAEDARNDAYRLLIKKLNALRDGDDTKPITDFRGYTAVTAANAFNAHLRVKYPQRYTVETALRYLIDKRDDFALWKDSDQKTLCGFTPWRAASRKAIVSRRLEQLRREPQAFAQACGLDPIIPYKGTARLLAALLNWLGHPIPLEDLVRAVAELWCLRDETPQTESTQDPGARQVMDTVATGVMGAGVVDNRAPEVDVVAMQAQMRDYLRLVWAAVIDLPRNQCAVLLLNLRDHRGRGIIVFLPLLGIAQTPEIAQAVGLTLVQLEELWADLPLEDARIAQLLGTSPSAVSNLRLKARKRLTERLRESEGKL